MSRATTDKSRDIGQLVRRPEKATFLGLVVYIFFAVLDGAVF